MENQQLLAFCPPQLLRSCVIALEQQTQRLFDSCSAHFALVAFVFTVVNMYSHSHSFGPHPKLALPATTPFELTFFNR